MIASKAWQGRVRPSRQGLPACSERGALALLLLGVAVAGWPTLRALLALAGGDTPVSFVPLVGPIGAVLLLHRCDPARLRAEARDSFVDGLALLALLGATTVVLFLLPVTMSWDYALDRLDVPGLVLLLGTLVVAAWGLPGLARLAPALFYLLLSWPLPYTVLYNRIAPPLTDATAAAARTLAALLPLGVRADPSDPYGVLVPVHGRIAGLVIAQGCAGVNGALGLAVIGLPVAAMARGSWESRGAWLLLGVALSWVVNLARILLIVVATATWGRGPTMALLHPELGIILFAASFALLLALAPLCGLDTAAPWRAPPRPPRPPRPTGSPGLCDSRGAVAASPARWGGRRLLLLGIILGGGALAEYGGGQPLGVSEATLPRVGVARADDLFRPPMGWRVARAEAIDDWRPYFGPSTVASALTVASAAGARVGVQAILTRDAGAFSAYGVEDCYAFHGFALRAVRRVALDGGVSATLVDFAQGVTPSAALYWVQPVQTPQGLYHERIVLVADATDMGRAAARPGPWTLPSSPVQGVAVAVAGFFSPWVGGDAGPAFRAMNSTLQGLGRAVIAAEGREMAAGRPS